MIIYLAQPYSINADENLREERYQIAVKMVAKFMNEGYNIFSPILNSHEPARQYGLPNTWEYWERVDKEYIAICGELWVLCLPGWLESKGVAAEIEYAEQIGIPIKYIEV